jgi:hypothetical protein
MMINFLIKSSNRIICIGFVTLIGAVGVGVWVGPNHVPSDPSAVFGGKTVSRNGTGPHRNANEAANSKSRPSSETSKDFEQDAALGAEKLSSTASPALGGFLDEGPLDVDSRVRAMQGMRGVSFSEADRKAALQFLAGKNIPAGMGKGSSHWLADEVLTSLRLQEPPWPDMAKALGEVAFRAETDPVIRDYIMQHLGLIWEKTGPQPEIEKSLWQAVTTSDETTPGTALLALSRGYARDQKEEPQKKVRQQALSLASDANTQLAVRVTALSIAGEGGGVEVKALATSLTQDPKTPVILRKVAERVVNRAE